MRKSEAFICLGPEVLSSRAELRLKRGGKILGRGQGGITGQKAADLRTEPPTGGDSFTAANLDEYGGNWDLEEATRKGRRVKNPQESKPPSANQLSEKIEDLIWGKRK